jgi:hypothetical protein
MISVKEISQDIYKIHIERAYYMVYRISARYYRVESNKGKFKFNFKAYSIDKLVDFLARMDYEDEKTKINNSK